MSTTLQRPTRYAQDVMDRPVAVETRGSLLRDPRYQAFWTLRIGFTVLPIAMGIDKFFNAMVFWPQYLADWIANIVGNARTSCTSSGRWSASPAYSSC